jgi:hypothetical protein
MRPHLLALLLLFIACGDHGKDTDDPTHGGHEGGSTSEPTTASSTDPTTGAAQEPPAAPTDLTAALLDGGAHLVWKDVSDDEDNFVIERKADGDADFAAVIELPFDSVTYHDTAVSAATRYTYRVVAVNTAGEAVSNEVTLMVP